MDNEVIWVETPSYPASSDPHYDDPPEELPDHGIRAVLFDLDGTLVEAQDWHKEAFDMALEGFGYPRLDYDDHIANFNGLSTLRKLEILSARGVVKDDFDHHKNINAFKQVFTKEVIDERCKPIPRVIDVLTFCKTAGYKIGLVTNCSRRSALQMCKLARLDGFDVIVTNQDVNGKIKPSPYPWLKAQYALGLSRKECLSIDDSPTGVRSILDAGHRLWRLKNFEDLKVRNLMDVIASYRITI